MTEGKRSIFLFGALLLPVLYFGAQLVLPPTCPHDRFMTDAASLPGSDTSPYAVVFSTVAMLSGRCGIAGA